MFINLVFLLSHDLEKENTKRKFLIFSFSLPLFSRFLPIFYPQVIRLTVFVTDTTAPALQQGKGLLIITIIDINEQPPVSIYAFFFFWHPNYIFICYVFTSFFVCRNTALARVNLAIKMKSGSCFGGLGSITLRGTLFSIKSLSHKSKREEKRERLCFFNFLIFLLLLGKERKM